MPLVLLFIRSRFHGPVRVSIDITIGRFSRKFMQPVMLQTISHSENNGRHF